jgi:hypothetical protein
MSIIYEVRSGYKVVVSEIDPSLLLAENELIPLQRAQRHAYLVIIQVVSTDIFGGFTKLKTVDDISF